MKTSHKPSTILILMLAGCGLVVTAGCGMKDFKPSKIFSLDNAWPFDDDEDEPEEGIPVRIVGAWTDTVKTQPGQKAQRGFGGRLMFYDNENEKPILVDGQLVVYAFEETGRPPTDNKPTRRYVFPADQMKLRMSKNEIGASYSFWLPWDEAGGPKTEVSLISRFEPKGGAVITGEQTRHVLPGSMPTETPNATASGPRVPEGVPMRPAQMTLEQYQAQQRAQSGVQTAGYETPVNPQAGAATGVATAGTAGASAPSKQMSVTDIALPRQFQLPEGTNPQPIATASQANRAGHMQRPASAAQYQQPFYQQPAAAMQPVMQAVQPPVVNGAAVMQQIPPTGGQWQQPNAIGQRPVTMTPINAPGIYVPQNQPMAAPINVPQYVGTQPIMPQAAQSMPPQYQGGMMPQQQAAAIPTQQMTTMPAQQMVPQPAYPQQGYQQAPATNGVRTAVSYGPPPATIPWR